MKKILTILTILTIFTTSNVAAITVPEVTDAEKVNVYIFRGDGCGYCEELVSYINDQGDTYDDYMNVILLETWYNQTNSAIKEQITEDLGIGSVGVPFVVIGDEYIVGYNGEGTIQKALDLYSAKDNTDIVNPLINKDNIDNVESLEEATEEEGLVYNGGFELDKTFLLSSGSSETPKENSNTLIIVLIAVASVCVIAGGMYYYMMPKKKITKK